jgi:hypothetical protein
MFMHRLYPNSPRSGRPAGALFGPGAIFLASVVACSPASFAEKPHPTTLPTTHLLKLSDAVALDTLQVEDLETTLTDKLRAPQVKETTYFGEIDEYVEDDDKPVASLPIIALHRTDTWTAVPLVGEGLRNAGWKYVAAGPAPGEVWGVLDTAAGNTRSTFAVAHSIDGAETFTISAFHKPCKQAQFFDFAMSRDGHGRMSLTLDTDCGIHKAGVYHFETNDDGKTWSTEPRYEPDVMKRADEVPDEEQPNETTSGTKTLLRTSTKSRNSR